MADAEGSVIWLDIRSRGYPWWPCKVESIDGELVYVSFKDNIPYHQCKFTQGKIRRYDCEERLAMITEGKKRLRQKKDTLEIYCDAIREADEYIKQEINSNFILDPTPNISISTTTPKQPLLDSSIFTTRGTESCPDETCWSSDEGTSFSSSGLVKSCRKRRRNETTPLSNTRSVRKRKTKSAVLVRKKRLPSRKTVQPQRLDFRDDALPTAPLVPEFGTNTTNLPNTKGRKQESNGKCFLLENGQKMPPSDNIQKYTPRISPPTLSSENKDSGFNADSDSERQPCSESSSDEDEDLPSVDLTVKEFIKIHELKPFDVVWAKYSKFPFWPALITKVKSKKNKVSESTAYVYFFGYNDKTPLKISKSKNIAHFATKRSEDFYREAKAWEKGKEYFEQGFKEADNFIKERAEGRFNNGSPKKVFMEVKACRPKSYRYSASLLEECNPSLTPSLTKEDGSHHSEMTPNPDDSSTSESEVEEEKEEGEELPYTYDRVVSEITEIKPVLLGIIRGEVESDFHKIYETGSSKEQKQLKVGQKYGPIKRWTNYKKNNLLEQVLQPIGKDVGERYGNIRYAFDVLLPEAMIRVKSRVENIPIEEALREFET